MKYYVMNPDLTPYEGVKVTKDLELNFENAKVKQTIKDLKLVSEYTFTNEKYTSKNILEMNLDEGEVLLFEAEDRGYFLPLGEAICTVKEAIEQYETLSLALDGENKDKGE